MTNQNRRKDSRYDVFIQITLFIPSFLGKNEQEITGWIKNISQKGIALEICISSSDEIHALLETVAQRQNIGALISLPGEAPIKAECQTVWGILLENKNFYIIGLRILSINPLEKYKWDSFIEHLSSR
jgi:hypothetical protein